MKLVPCFSLTDAQQQMLLTLKVKPSQRKFCGTVDSALYLLTGTPALDIQGLVLLEDDSPRGFLLVLARTMLPSWAEPDAVMVSALQIDRNHQGRGLGKACMQLLPSVVLPLWPHATHLELSVAESNLAALQFYTALGWHPAGAAYKHERRMTLPLR